MFSCSSKKSTAPNAAISSSSSAVVPIGVIPNAPVIAGTDTVPTVTIGTQVWTARNVKALPSAGQSWCYDNLDADCAALGRLYDRTAALSICPTGSHLPSIVEWDQLIVATGGHDAALAALKSTVGWGIVGVDSYGMGLIAAGNFSDSTFGNLGNFAAFWTSTDTTQALSFTESTIQFYGILQPPVDLHHYGFSVRCVK